MSDTTETTESAAAVHPEFERGAKAAAESMRFYFLNESERSIYPDLSTEILEQNERFAVADALSDERARLERIARLSHPSEKSNDNTVHIEPAG